MEEKKCCANCVHRYWVDEKTYACDDCADETVKKNPCGIYLFSAEEAKNFSCMCHHPEIGHADYYIMCYSMWEKTFWPNLRKMYQQYVDMMYARQNVDHKYRLTFNFSDAHGLEGDYEEVFTDRDKAIAAAIDASKDENNYNIHVRHEWLNKRIDHIDGYWEDWEKEIKK